MKTAIAGVTGNLFPDGYLREQLADDAFGPGTNRPAARDHTNFVRWWTTVVASCGPATGQRAIFDLVAMPLFGMLGFRARDARFERHFTATRLVSHGGAHVALLVLPWTERPSAVWKDANAVSREQFADWCFVLAPPFLSLVDARGHASRRHVDFDLRRTAERPWFLTLRAIAHASAFDRVVGASSTHLDALAAAACRFQDRVRDDLQRGMASSLAGLSRVVAASRHDRRPRLGQYGIDAFDEALTIAYRILFLLFAESRELTPQHAPIYRDAYSIGALCRDALVGAQTTGLWESLAAISRLFRSGCRTNDLNVAAFNGPLFRRTHAPALETRRTGRGHGPWARDRDDALRDALVALGARERRGGRQQIDYRDLGVEQLGAVYERVLDLKPDTPANGSPRPQDRRTAHTALRKQTGTFYTPQPLAEFVVRRTLAPLVAGLPADRILTLRILDPAMGSGAFLIAACRYLAAAYEHALIDEGRVSPVDLDEDERAGIRRLVAERCLAGVDRNPAAVQVARLSMWLATLARGRPLAFLDHRLRVGDSLVGASPADLRRVRGLSRAGADAPMPLFGDDPFERDAALAVDSLATFRTRPDAAVADVRAKESLWRTFTSAASPLHRWRLAGHVWCGRWFWPGGPSSAPRPAEVRAVLDALLKADRTLSSSTAIAEWLAIADRLAQEHRFFHWPVEFADVFYNEDGGAKAAPGFDAVIGNPPWEMLRRDERPCSGHDDRPSGRLVRFLRGSGLYPSCAVGHLNLYQPFVERALALTRVGGRVGLVLPWGLATDEGSSALRATLFNRTTIDTVVGIDNAAGMFPIHRGVRFMVAVTTTGGSTHEIRSRFGVKAAGELDELPAREDGTEPTAYPVRLERRMLSVLGGRSLRIPDLRRPNEATLAARVAARFPPLGDERGWHARFGRELNATDDRGSFGEAGLPVIEGKHLSPFRVDLNSRTRIEPALALARLPDARFEHARLGYRDVSGVANRQSLIAAIVPAGVVTTHTIFCLRTRLEMDAQLILCALFNSYVLNWFARLFMGGHLTTALVEGLPAPVDIPREQRVRLTWLARRAVERRGSARTEAWMHARVAHLYGLDEGEFRDVLATFPRVPDREKQLALEAFRARRASVQ